MFVPLVRQCLAGILMLVPLFGWTAGDSSSLGSLTLRDAIARTLKGNPEPLVFPPAKRVVEAERLQANFRPNPTLDLTAENFVGPSAARDQQQIALTLSQVIELGGKRAYRYGAADAALGTVEAEYVIARLDALAEMARRFTDTAQSQAEIELADRSVALAQGIAQSVERRIKAGAASTAERNRAQVALIRARIDAEHARSNLAARRIALVAMWGEQEPNFSTVHADLELLPPLEPIAPILDQLQQSPAFARFAAERRLREAERKLARAQAVPDLTAGLGVRRISPNNDYTLVASLSMPLPVYNRNQGEIAAATAKIEVSDAEREAAHLRIRAVLYGLYQEAVQVRARGGDPKRGHAAGRAGQVNKTIATVQKNLLEGAVLVIVVLFAFLGNLRAAVLTAMVIPLALFATFTSMVQSKVSGNLMSLGALDFGLIIDGALIIVENCLLRLAQAQHARGRVLGRSERFDAVRNATREVFRPSLVSVVVIVLVNLPIFALSGVEGKMFHPMAFAVIAALVGALIFSITFVPAACALFLTGKVKEGDNLLVVGAKRLYEPLLKWVLKVRWAVAAAAVVLIPACGWQASRMGAEFSRSWMRAISSSW